jgi:very-short-patch-repair endonuclease
MLDGPFLGSAAVAAGLLTPAELRSPRFAAVFRDVFVPAGFVLDLVGRSRAAHLLLPPDGALGGYSAAALHGASCGPPNAAAEIVAPRGDVRKRRGLVVRQCALDPADVDEVAGLRVTSPRRTADHLGRRLPLVDAVVALDALVRVGRFAPADLLHGAVGARGRRRLGDAVALADARAESPMETRLRVLIVLAGLPAPVPQYRVRDRSGVVRARVDLAYPDARLALEYDGAHHFDALHGRSDRRRDLELDELDWHTMRFVDADLFATPQDTVRRIRHRLEERLGRAA